MIGMYIEPCDACDLQTVANCVQSMVGANAVIDGLRATKRIAAALAELETLRPLAVEAIKVRQSTALPMSFVQAVDDHVRAKREGA